MSKNSPEEIAKIKSELWKDSTGEASTLSTFSVVNSIVAEGDSWFDYLPELDILDNLKRVYGYSNLIKISRAGDTLDNMVYGTKFKSNWEREQEEQNKLLGQLRDRLREIAETPLLLKMLCEVFDPKTRQIPQNKGELFDLFDRKYQHHKEGVAVSDDFRRFQSEVLQYLGFTMLRGDAQKPTEAWLTLPRQRAEGMLEDWLKHRGEANPASKAKEWLEDLVEHHLLQVAADPQQIEFHHQLFQEYYAARHLKSMLQGQHPDVVVDERLKHLYLNYLKWTEPLGLLLGLLDDEPMALRLVGLGFEVDYFLGARLAGEVKQRFQQQTVRLVNKLIVEKNLPRWLKFKLWEKKRSSEIIPKLSISGLRSSLVKEIFKIGDSSNFSDLLPLLRDTDPNVRWQAVEAIVELGDSSNFSDLLPLLRDTDSNVRSNVIRALATLGDSSNFSDLLPLLQDFNSNVRWQVVDAIIELGDKRNISDLLPLLQNSNSNVRLQVLITIVELGDKSNLLDVLPLLKDSNSSVRLQVVETIMQLGDSSDVSELVPLLKDSNSNVRSRAIDAIVELGDKSNLPDLLPLLQDSESNVRSSAVKSIGQLGGENAVIVLTDILNVRGANMRKSGAKGLGEIKEWKEVRPLTRSLAIVALINSLDTHHESVRIAAARSLTKIGNFKILPRLHQKLTESKDYKVVEIIFAVQAKCEFYNYDIFRIPPTNRQSSPQSLTVNINKLGTLNTSPVHIQGNQIGIQQPVDPQ